MIFATFTKKTLALALLSIVPALAHAAPQSNAWQMMTRADANFVGDWMLRQSIGAVYPDADAYSARLTQARRILEQELPHVDNYQGYRHALNHFVGSFQDMHLSVAYALSPNAYQWPGFSAVYRNLRYYTAASKGAISDGQEISECDGRPMASWIRGIATYEQMIFDLESTSAEAAPLIFRDAGNPFLPRPKSCTIGGKQIALAWGAIPASQINAAVNALTPPPDRLTAISAFGADGAWVRMGIFLPGTQNEGLAFKQLFAEAPGLRSKSVIVLDVRGNGGGPYEWFMGFLRALYGGQYTDYYARARLGISAVFRLTPEILAYFNEDVAAETDALVPPPDGERFDPHNTEFAAALKAGKPLLVAPKKASQIPQPRQAPANPVKAKVYVLTDYSCASACIAFVDELKRFPGVEQIGVDTSVDSRTGTPFGTPLPSGNGTVYVPVMTRDGRERDDNVPQKPTRVFTGNINDTAAVKAWLQADVLPSRP
ncbi:S41 family peptidase [Oxalobacteraceae bacterium OTU3CINTB1]|nr:S41 family peptidase [Oxalobacteraceae bacterium OTU3CINTB1]